MIKNECQISNYMVKYKEVILVPLVYKEKRGKNYGEMGVLI